MLAGGTEALDHAARGRRVCRDAGPEHPQRRSGQRASRPFDADRDGFVIAEGAGMLVLEELEHARQRGAHHLLRAGRLRPHLRRLPHHRPRRGRAAGAPARMRPGHRATPASPRTDIDYINAHGTSTGLNDKCETLAIKTAFGEAAARAWPSAPPSP